MHDMMMGGPMMVMGLLLMVTILVAVMAGVVWLVRTLNQDGGSRRGQGAVEQLDLRYSRGEIDRDEYLQRRNDLERR